MRIESSTLGMQGGSSVVSMMSIEESLNIWTGQGSASAVSSSFDVQEFSQQGITVNTSVTSSVYSTSISSEEEPPMTEQELKIKLLEDFLSRLCGKRVKFLIPNLKRFNDGYDSSGQASSNLKITFSDNRATRLGVGSGFGLIYNRSETQVEKSRVSFAAQGVVKTADGREINLNLNFNIDQQVVQQQQFPAESRRCPERSSCDQFRRKRRFLHAIKPWPSTSTYDGDQDTFRKDARVQTADIWRWT